MKITKGLSFTCTGSQKIYCIEDIIDLVCLVTWSGGAVMYRLKEVQDNIKSGVWQVII